jgi:hypothetical protein
VRSAEPCQLDRWCRSRGAGRRRHSRLARAGQAGAGADTSCRAGTAQPPVRTLGSLRPQPAGADLRDLEYKARTRAGRRSGRTGPSRRRPGPVAIRAAWTPSGRAGTPSGGLGQAVRCPRSPVPVRGRGHRADQHPRRRQHVGAPAAGRLEAADRMPGTRGPRPDHGPSQITGPGVRPLTTTRQMGHHPHIEQKSRNNLSWGPGCCRALGFRRALGWAQCESGGVLRCERGAGLRREVGAGLRCERGAGVRRGRGAGGWGGVVGCGSGWWGDRVRTWGSVFLSSSGVMLSM